MNISNWSPAGKAVGVIAVLCGSGLIYNLFVQERVKTEEIRRKFTQEIADSSARVARMEEERKTSENERLLLASRLESAERRMANVSSTTNREIIRVPYDRLVPTPATGGKDPSVVVIPTPPSLSERDVVELIRETIKTEDKSVTESGKTEDRSETKTVTKTEDKTTKAEDKSETKTVTKTEDETTTKVETKPAADPEPGAIGIGVTDKARPFISFDVTKLPVGPKPLGLGKIGVGGFVETDTRARITDYGPQANYQKKRVFIMGGYGLKEKSVRIGIGVKF